MSNNKKCLIAAIVFTLCALSTFLVFSQTQQKLKDDLYKKLELFTDALVLIKNEYADEPKLDDLIGGALKGMVGSLDPYSEYLDAERYNELKIDTEGKFGGLGIEITIKEGILTVITPIEDTPAWGAGVKAGDRIVKIDGQLTKNITISDAVKKLRGLPGTEVTLTILRENELKLLDLKIRRDTIKIRDIKDAMILQDNIGYLRLVEFRENTPRDLEQTLSQLRKSGMDSLILDLRNNPGGLLDVAVKVTEKFLPPDKIVVYTRGRLPNQNMEFRTRQGKAILDIPIAVLVNEGSASGSEIVAGALKDYKRAVIIGKKTFGKGSVQSVLPLSDGSALKLTTSKYFTPSGRVINNEGVEPDIVVEAGKVEVTPEDSEADEIFISIENTGKIKAKDEAAKPPSAAKQKFNYTKDNQIVHALEVIKGIKVYKAMNGEK